MSFADQVRAANSPQAALLIIAEALDLVIHNIQVPAAVPPDPWGTNWTPVVNAGAAIELLREADSAPTDRRAEIQVIENALAVCSDGEDRRALEAQLVLLKDTGRPAADPSPAAGHRVTATDEEVVIPPASPEVRAIREQFAREKELGALVDPPLDEEAMVAAFTAGGPMWLYNYDRAAVLAMPEDWRRGFVLDVDASSPADASELSRDILKDPLAPSQQVSLEGQTSEAASRG